MPQPSTQPTDAAVSASQRALAGTLAAAAFVLLLLGGLVTTYRVGMAVPDWPTTFGHSMFAYPLDEMLANFGVTVEHGHRLAASLVGLLTILTLTAAAWRASAKLRAAVFGGLLIELAGWTALIAAAPTTGGSGLGAGPLACLAITGALLLTVVFAARAAAFLRAAALVHVLVVAQGLLGGTRVLQNAPALAFLHGALAQLVWASIAGLLVVASTAWQRAPLARGRPPRVDVRASAALGSFLVYTQIVAGAWLRHSGRMDALAVHALWALAVVVALIRLGGRLGQAARERSDSEGGVLLGLRRWLWSLLGLQITLGLASTAAILVFSGGFAGRVALGEAISATLHVAVGAALLGCTLAAWMWAGRGVPQAQRAPSNEMAVAGGGRGA